MSTVKNPEDKKLLSLKKDRRNMYGENPAASRKGIALGKRRSSKVMRRAVGEILEGQKGPSEGLDLEAADVRAKERGLVSQRKAFKKTPDRPLADALIMKKTSLSAYTWGGEVVSPEKIRLVRALSKRPTKGK